ncbi:hypothetical protein [Leptospira sp. GIMC2001]|uniref:hypothetical protein n=1 Tax=Leptospira sp. GIMC2001 TaxID=1513297 RepID=UPI002349092E|nr:hypothetical protein [Leptospira sp. GIMC2001]WCL48877.1 hypothetical protein O4O04_16475 [Leptospira sp. GIMC2001]
MITFLTLSAVLATVAFFLYMLSAYDNKNMDRSSSQREAEENKFRAADPKKIYSKEWDPNVQRPRICPACGTFLKKDEYLYAAISEYTNSEGKRQAHIYGCKYCYLGEANSEGIQRQPRPMEDL